jgi:anaerobic selenocysteine-containing dehydrogenase
VLPPATERPAAGDFTGAQVVLIDGANPAYTMPGSLAHVESVISFSGFPDDSAELILPDHHALESEMAVLPAVAPQAAVNLGTPFIRPLYDTRAVEQTLGDIAKKVGVEYRAATVKDLLPEDANVQEVRRQGGWWGEAPETPIRRASLALDRPGGPSHDGLVFQAYPSVQFGDGTGMPVPWLQEVPDPVSSAIWGLPAEIDPQTAAQHRIATGDSVRIESQHGSIEGSAYVHPGAIPGVVSMGIGGRGANPLVLTAGARITNVRLTRLGPCRNLIQFSTPDREEITRR